MRSTILTWVGLVCFALSTTAQINITGTVQGADDGQFLRGERNAGPEGIGGLVRFVQRAVQPQLATIFFGQSGEDVYQRGLAGAVFTDEGVDLAASNGETDVGEHRRGIGLVQIPNDQARVIHGCTLVQVLDRYQIYRRCLVFEHDVGVQRLQGVVNPVYSQEVGVLVGRCQYAAVLNELSNRRDVVEANNGHLAGPAGLCDRRHRAERHIVVCREYGRELRVLNEHAGCHGYCRGLIPLGTLPGDDIHAGIAHRFLEPGRALLRVVGRGHAFEYADSCSWLQVFCQKLADGLGAQEVVRANEGDTQVVVCEDGRIESVVDVDDDDAGVDCTSHCRDDGFGIRGCDDNRFDP